MLGIRVVYKGKSTGMHRDEIATAYLVSESLITDVICTMYL